MVPVGAVRWAYMTLSEGIITHGEYPKAKPSKITLPAGAPGPKIEYQDGANGEVRLS